LLLSAVLLRRPAAAAVDRYFLLEPKKRAWRHGRAWKMKIRAWKNQDPCFNFYKHIYALLHEYPV